MLQLSLGFLLHCLSACGHESAHSLAESVGAKWLQECESCDSSQVSYIGVRWEVESDRGQLAGKTVLPNALFTGCCCNTRVGWTVGGGASEGCGLGVHVQRVSAYGHDVNTCLLGGAQDGEGTNKGVWCRVWSGMALPQ